MATLPTHIVRHGEPSRSALTVASLPLLGASAEAALRDDPFVFNDPLSRGLRAALVVRSRVVEDELARCVAAGVRQYVVLGAGLDTFSYRNPYTDEGLRVFEVDHPGTQRWKQQLLAEAGIDLPASLTFVAMDFERDDLGVALRQAGFQVGQAACVSWMGVTMYLTAGAVLTLLGTVARFAAGSCLCFDYRVPSTMLNPIERAVSDVMEQQLAALGEPWRSSFDPARLQSQLLGLGFSSAGSATADDLNMRYLARRKDGLRTGGGVRIMGAMK